MIFKKEEAYEKYKINGNNVAKAARDWCRDNDTPYLEKYWFQLSRYVKSFDSETSTETNQYKNDNVAIAEEFVMPSAWDAEQEKFLGIDEYCDKYNLPKHLVRSSKLVSHIAGHMVYNIAFNTSVLDAENGIDAEFIEEIVKKHINIVKPYKINHAENDWFDRLVYADVHLAMDVNAKSGDPLYDGKWDAEEAISRVKQMVAHTLRYSRGSTLVIDDLGDLLDGLGGATTRKGHELPQNMNDKEAFDLAVQFKMVIIDELIPYYNKIICNNITEDNHSGVFSYFVNSAVKSIVSEKYGDAVEYNIEKRFIGHYIIGNHTFLICHGKDSEALKFGFKPVLDPKQSEKIDQYCKEHKLYDGNYIEFSKGDSHQAMYDFTTSNDFAYCNYPAFSPASNWVKTNFKNTKSGFVLYNIDKVSQVKISIPYFFE